MASTSADRDRNAREVRRLSAAGLSQRQIADRLNITRPMVQRILVSSDPAELNGSDDSDVDEFRGEVLAELRGTGTWRGQLHSFLLDGEVDPLLYQIEAAEVRFNSEYELTGRRAVKAAKLARMMGEGELT
jgi:hypothetical protein